MGLTSAPSKLRLESLTRLGVWPGVDRKAFLHWSVELTEATRGQIRVGPWVRVGPRSWLNTPVAGSTNEIKLDIGEGCSLGRFNVLSAQNEIVIEPHVVTAPSVLIMDHAHEYADPEKPILHQGTTEGGRIRVETGAWIGFGAVVVSNRGELTVGRNSVVAANSVVLSDVPPRTVVAGSPARVVRRYDENAGEWVKA